MQERRSLHSQFERHSIKIAGITFLNEPTMQGYSYENVIPFAGLVDYGAMLCCYLPIIRCGKHVDCFV